MLIRLEFNGAIVEEIRSAEISSEITIGRSKKCTWTVPTEDAVISGHHASLTPKKNAVWYTDCNSKNGSFFQGKRISRHRLRVGDRLSLGESVLIVEKEDAVSAIAGGQAEIAVRTGKTRGQKKAISTTGTKIGSDPASDIMLLDTLVSRNHAEITLKDDGSCWVKDMGSKNGTSVNGLPLRADKERMLKDGDVIAIAHLELVFSDGSKQRSSGQAWLRMGIMAATLVLALILYWAYQHVRPPAAHFINQARQLAAAENFEAADEALVKATGARNLASHRLEVEDMKRLLSVWESTTALWRRAQVALSEGDWVGASRDLGMLQARQKEAWEWSEEGPIEKHKALQAKSMLDALLSAKSAVRREDITVDELKLILADITTAMAQDESATHLAKAREELSLAKADVEKVIREGSGLEEALNKLVQNPPPFEDMIQAVRAIRDSSGGTIRRKAELVHDGLVGLGLSYARKVMCSQLAREVQLKQARAMELELVSVEDCAVDSRLSAARTMLEESFKELKTAIVQIAYLQDQILKLVDDPDASLPSPIRLWHDDDVMTKVWACDSVAQPLPRRTRKMASGEYDRMLGVEEFYYTLSILPDPVDQTLLDQMPIQTVLSRSRELVKRISAFTAFLGQPETKWLAYGKLGQLVTHYEGVLKERDAIVEEMTAKAKTATGREALIAGGIAVALAADPDEIKMDGVEFKTWLPKALKDLRTDLVKMNDAYSAAPPTSAIEIREQIMAIGLPGDPIVRRMWASRDASQTD